MKSAIVLFLLILACYNSGVDSSKSYKDHKVVLFTIDNEEQLLEVQRLEQEAGFIFMDPPIQVKMKLELVIQPGMFEVFQSVAIATGIDYEITTDDLQSWIDAEKPLKNRKDGFALDRYNLLEEIYQFVDDIQLENPETATVITIGESFEGRPLKVVKISTNDNNPAVFIEANIHAREWISSATAVWLINEFLTMTNVTVKEVIDSVTWYILPVTNPDGYKYTHEKNRLWRRMRSLHNILCPGVDPNRNFGYNFRMGGTSTVPCSETYSGPYAFSESETKALMDFYATIADRAELYLSFHSAAQMLLYPMGHTESTELVPNEADLFDIAEAAIDSLTARHGTTYQFGNTVTVLYAASGTSPDHAYGLYGTPLAYTYELRTGTGTESRFVLNPEEIIPNAHEILESLMGLIAKAKELNYFQIKP